MANVKISDLPAATSNAVADIFVCNQSGTTKRSTLQLLIDLIEATGLTFTVAQAFAAITGTTLTLTSYAIANGIKLDSLPAGFRNGTVDASAASNAITITFETQASATPSATDPVSMTHRSATITSGATTTRNQTAALSLVIPSGATLGCASSEAVRIHVVGILNAASAMELAVFTAAVTASTSIQRFDPTALRSTTAIGTGSDSTQTLYSTTSRTDQPVVYLGYIEATSGATAGQWSIVDKIVNWEPGIPLPGEMVQYSTTQSGALVSGTGQIPLDNTIPEITEGTQGLSRTHTPRSAHNFLEVSTFVGMSDNSATTQHFSFAIFDGSTNAIAASIIGTGAAATALGCGMLSIFKQAGSASEITFTMRFGSNVAATYELNGSGGGEFYGGTIPTSNLIVREYHI